MSTGYGTTLVSGQSELAYIAPKDKPTLLHKVIREYNLDLSKSGARKAIKAIVDGGEERLVLLYTDGTLKEVGRNF